MSVWWVGMAWLVWGGAGWGGGRSPGMLALLETGRSRVVVEQVSARLASSPDDPELHALLGIAWARTGYYADALGAFAFAPGAETYEELGLEAHATALRVCVGGEAAAALRLQRLLAPVGVFQEHRIWMNAADDLREAGSLEAAQEYALQGYAAFPSSGVMAAVMADIAMDQGELEEADFYIWLAGEGLGGGERLEAVRIRRALLDGDVGEALARSQQVQQGGTGGARLGALRAEALRQSGDPAEALAFLERNRWRLSEDPELLAVRLRVLVDLGQIAEARALGVRLASLGGHLVVVQQALQALPAPPPVRVE